MLCVQYLYLPVNQFKQTTLVYILDFVWVSGFFFFFFRLLLFSVFAKQDDEMHYIDVIMITMASQITSPTVVYSIVYSGLDQRKHQSSASLAFVWGIHRDRWIPRTKGQ